MPDSQPTISISTKIIAIFNAVVCGLNGMTPARIMVNAESRSPITRNFLASERSDTLPIMNLLNA